MVETRFSFALREKFARGKYTCLAVVHVVGKMAST